MSTKWERWPLCWWYRRLDRNVRLCCQVVLPVPASEITAFGVVAATQEAEKTPLSSGKKFAQLCIQCVLVAGLLSPACLQALCSAHTSDGGSPTFPRCCMHVGEVEEGRSWGDCFLTSLDRCGSLFFYLLLVLLRVLFCKVPGEEGKLAHGSHPLGHQIVLYGTLKFLQEL